MSHFPLRLIVFWLAAGAFVDANSAVGNDGVVARLLPETTVGFLEVSEPSVVMARILDHPLSTRIQAMDVFTKATQSKEYRSFLTGRKLFELQIGMDWRPAIEALTAGGIYAAADGVTEGLVLLVRAKDEAVMENFRVKILELTRLSGEQKKPDDYRGLSIYKLDKGGAAVVRDWLVVTNNADLGKGVLDRLLDAQGNSDDAEEPVEKADPAGVVGTLSANAEFQRATQMRDPQSQVWAFANLKSLRDAGKAKKIFEGKAENPLAELLAGGIQSTLQQAICVSSNLTLTDDSVQLRLSTPWQADWIPEERTYFFGPDGNGKAPALPVVPETLLTLATYRNVSEMWLRAGDLFDEQINDKLAEADSGLSTVFAGRDFGEEILGSFEPQIGIVVARQDFTAVSPVPAIRLPAFALVMTLREPEVMRSELRRTFQSAIGFFNIVGAQNGNPQLEMDMQKSGDVDLITSRYLPLKKDQDSTSAPIIYNFSPSAGFSGSRFVLSSTASLAQQLAAAPVAQSDAGVNTHLMLDAGVLTKTLDDNREQLISQNMMTEGRSREESEASIDLLLEFIRNVKDAGLTLDQKDEQLNLQLRITVNP
jgi:hypothetical protein